MNKELNMMEVKDTVIISLEKYEEMQKEIKDLREKVQRKTIIEYVHTPVLYWVALVLAVSLFIWIALNTA